MRREQPNIAAAYLDNNDSSEVLTGEQIGYLGLTDGGVGRQWTFGAPPTGANRVFIQDRTGGTVEKGYIREVAAFTAMPIGWQWGR